MDAQKTTLAVALSLICVAPLAAQSAEELVACNVARRGGRAALAAIETTRVAGTMGRGEDSSSFTIEAKLPDKVRVEFTVADQTVVQAFDGVRGWGVMPYTGNREPLPLTGEALTAIRSQTDLVEGPLVDYAEKGHRVELVGKAEVEGTPAYDVKLTKADGQVVHVFLDADSCLELKDEGTRRIGGQEVTYRVLVSDYREAGGVLFAHRFEQSIDGMPTPQTLTIESIEVNVPIDEARFAMPAATPEDRGD